MRMGAGVAASIFCLTSMAWPLPRDEVVVAFARLTFAFCLLRNSTQQVIPAATQARTSMWSGRSPLYHAVYVMSLVDWA